MEPGIAYLDLLSPQLSSLLQSNTPKRSLIIWSHSSIVKNITSVKAIVSYQKTDDRIQTQSGVHRICNQAYSSFTLLSVMFIFSARNFNSRRIRYEKSVLETGARKWSRFMAPVFGACVMGIRNVKNGVENSHRNFSFKLPNLERFQENVRKNLKNFQKCGPKGRRPARGSGGFMQPKL